MLCSANLTTPSPRKPQRLNGAPNTAPLDLTHLIKASTKRNYLVRRKTQQTIEASPSQPRLILESGHPKPYRQSVEFEEVAISLESGTHARNRSFQKMYPWMDFRAFIVEDKFAKLAFTPAQQQLEVLLLDIKPKALDPNAPLIIFSMGADENLGSLCHFLVDLACQLKSEIVTFEFSTPLEFQNQELKLSDRLVSHFTSKIFDFVDEELSHEGKRKIFVYGQREGAIAATLLASQKTCEIAGLILEDALIYFYEKKGLFQRRSKQTRFLELFKTMKGVSYLLLHGIKGEACPFSHAKAIMKNIFSDCRDKCQVLSESRSSQNGVNQFRKSVVYKQGLKEERESSFIFESYFVECDTNEMRKLKRVQFYSTVNNFVSNVSSFIDEKHEMKNPYQFCRMLESNEESESTINKTQSLFFISKLEPSEKLSNLIRDDAITEENENEQISSKEEEAPPLLIDDFSFCPDLAGSQEQKQPLYFEIKGQNYESGTSSTHKISTASSEGKVFTPSTSGEDVRSKIANKLRRGKSSFAFSNFTQKSTIAIETMKRRVKELEQGLESTDQEDDKGLHLTPTNFIDPRQCCRKD